MAVKISVVLYQLFLAVLLGNKENRGHLGGYRWSDLPARQVFIEELIEFLPFLGRQGIDTPLLQFKTFHELNFVVKSTAMLWKWYISFGKYYSKPFVLFR